MFFKKKYKSANTRQFKRLRVDYLVKCEVVGSIEEPILSNLKDISSGGLRFWTGKPLEEGNLVRITCFLPPLDRQIESLARVVRVRRAIHAPIYYVGISFIELTKEDQADINRFIEDVADNRRTRSYVDHKDVVERYEELQLIS